MQDDLQDLMNESNEVQELLGRSYMTPDFIDDDELDAGKRFPHCPMTLLFLICICRIGCIGIGAVV